MNNISTNTYYKDNLEVNPQTCNVNNVTAIFNLPDNLILKSKISKKLLKRVFFPQKLQANRG